MIGKTIRFLLAAVLVTVIYFILIQQRVHKPRPADRGAQVGRRDRSERPRDGAGIESGNGAAGNVICETQYFADWREPSLAACAVRIKNGYPEPDPRCTPGGVNPSVTLGVLRDASWRTRAVRNCASSEAQKHVAYRWYGIQKPRINSNQNQICELDHLVPLELGGSDGLGNIWPECGPDAVTLNQRYFRQKDHVENYLAEEVKAGRMSLSQAQQGIARDWTQYLEQADMWCGQTGRC